MEKADINNRFTYHAPSSEKVEVYEYLRDSARTFALLINDFCPESREKSLAITKLEEVIFWANASIARR